MVTLPLWVYRLLPNPILARLAKRRWAGKTDDQLLMAHLNYLSWIGAGASEFAPAEWKMLAGVCQQKIDCWVLPEIKRRGIEYALQEGFES